jgi:hypothetical protein
MRVESLELGKLKSYGKSPRQRFSFRALIIATRDFVIVAEYENSHTGPIIDFYMGFDTYLPNRYKNRL